MTQNLPKSLSTVRSTDDYFHSGGFTVVRELGEGAYAKVLLLRQVRDDQTKYCAVKVTDLSRASADFLRSFFPREVEIIRRLRHPYIIQTHLISQKGNKFFFFMRYAEKGDLLTHLTKNGPERENQARVWSRQLSLALQYLHRMNIAHRDLKCENILISAKNNVKLSDFGFARYTVDIHGQKMLSNTFCGSICYAAPEILRGVRYDCKMADMWSLGVVIYIMLNRAMPFTDFNLRALVEAQMQRLYSFKEPMRSQCSEQVQYVVRRLLEPYIQDRYSLHELINSDWFAMDSRMATLSRAEQAALSEASLARKTPPERFTLSTEEPQAEVIIYGEPANASRGMESSSVLASTSLMAVPVSRHLTHTHPAQRAPFDVTRARAGTSPRGSGHYIRSPFRAPRMLSPAPSGASTRSNVFPGQGGVSYGHRAAPPTYGAVTQAQGVAAPVQGGAAPVQGVAAPVQRVAASVQGVAASVQGVAAPVQGVAAPVQGVAAPVQGVAAPVQGVAAPVQGVAAPAQGVAAPAQGVAAPSRGVAFQAQGMVTPAQELLTPSPGLHGLVTPSPGLRVPAHGVVKPAREAVKPAQEVVTPNQGAIAPSDPRVVTTTKEVPTPTQGVVTPAQGLVVPTQGVVMPNQGATAPAPRVVMTTEEESTPDQGVVTPNQGVTAPSPRVVMTTEEVPTPDQGMVTPEGVAFPAQREVMQMQEDSGAFQRAAMAADATTATTWDAAAALQETMNQKQ